MVHIASNNVRKNIIANNFGRCAQRYDRYAAIQKDTAEKLGSYLPDLDAPRILEIGCGTGFLTEELFARYPNGDFVISDLAPSMLDFAETRFMSAAPVLDNRTNFRVLDGEAPNLGAEQFDLIVSSMTMQWFENPLAGIETLRQFLKPDGKLYFSSLGERSFVEWQETLDTLSLSNGVHAGMALPGKFEEEERQIYYASTLCFLKSVKMIGAHHPKEGYAKLKPSDLKWACTQHDKKFNGCHTWHIVYGCMPPYAA